MARSRRRPARPSPASRTPSSSDTSRCWFSSYQLGGSLEGDCVAFVADDNVVANDVYSTLRSRCRSCSRCSAAHILLSRQSDSTASIAQLFCMIRNVRVAAASVVGRGEGWERCRAFAQPHRSGPASVLDAWNTLRKTVRRLCGSTRHPTLQERVKVLIEADASFNWLYYDASDSGVVPTPAEYFSLLAWDVTNPKLVEPPEAEPKPTDERLLLRENPLLMLFHDRWKETHWLFGSLHTKLSSLTDAGMGTTMKELDPIAPPLLSQWRDSIRDFSACRFYAFAVPTSAALDAISAYAPLVELGAGTGYWAALLRARGVRIRPLDSHPPQLRHNEYHGRCRAHTKVESGTIKSLRGLNDSSLLLCYPPPDSSMALDALLAFEGDTVLYVGEWFGDTATIAFQQALTARFSLVRRVPLPNWGNTSYDLSIWSRGGGNDGGLSAFACIGCGRAELPLYRCRLSCAVVFCSVRCQRTKADVHRRALLHRHLNVKPNELVLENGRHFRVFRPPTSKGKKRKRKSHYSSRRSENDIA